MTLALVASMAAILAGQSTPEGRALAYLSQEVPKWSAENKCFSCHNNGDAARALYTAKRLAYPLPAKALDDTSRWLAQPQKWDHNGGEGPFSDKGLARIQFAAALVDALDAGVLKEKQPLTRAAELVAEYQQKDGSWKGDGEGAGTLGSPATYGAALATYQARRILLKADSRQYKTALAKAEQWLSKVKVDTVLDASAVLLALEGDETNGAAARRKQCLEVIRKGQARSGGWGPYANTPAEPFDTAMVLLALSRLANQAEVKDLIKQGRVVLLSAQQKDGSWQETTRPSGAESYAQRVSTTGWATLALLATGRKP